MCESSITVTSPAKEQQKTSKNDKKPVDKNSLKAEELFKGMLHMDMVAKSIPNVKADLSCSRYTSTLEYQNRLFLTWFVVDDWFGSIYNILIKF